MTRVCISLAIKAVYNVVMKAVYNVVMITHSTTEFICGCANDMSNILVHQNKEPGLQTVATIAT